jgi:hypothetical protein
MLQVDVEKGELVWGGGMGGGGEGGALRAEVQRSLALTTKSLMELNTASAYATTVMRPFNGQRKRHHALPSTLNMQGDTAPITRLHLAWRYCK